MSRRARASGSALSSISAVRTRLCALAYRINHLPWIPCPPPKPDHDNSKPTPLSDKMAPKKIYLVRLNMGRVWELKVSEKNRRLPPDNRDTARSIGGPYGSGHSTLNDEYIVYDGRIQIHLHARGDMPMCHVYRLMLKVKQNARKDERTCD